MPFSPATHTPYPWDNAPATDTPLDSAHLEAAEQDEITYTQSVGSALDSYLESILAPLASPALTGSPTAPTQTSSDSSTKLATTAFAHTIAANLLAYLPVQATATTSGSGIAGAHNPYDATSGNLTVTLPSGSAAGTLISFEKVDSSTNTVALTGSLRDVGGQTITLKLQHETLFLEADSTGSWWPIASHKPLSILDTRYVQAAAPVLTANESAPLASPTYGATVTPNFLSGQWQTVTVTNTTAFTVAAPTNPPSSAQTGTLVIEVLNSSGGAMGAITWNAAFLFPTGTWTNPASTKRRFARFAWNGVNWICQSIATSDY